MNNKHDKKAFKKFETWISIFSNEYENVQVDFYCFQIIKHSFYVNNYFQFR
jgi:hypothetical protein